MKKLLLSIMFLFSLLVNAQENPLNQYITSSKGLGFTAKDSIFQLNLGFRIQSRAGYHKEEGQDGYIEAEIRRMRLKLDGFIYNPKFGYKIQLGFSAGDTGIIKTGENLNVIRDGVLFYKPNKNWVIAFGQTKLPGNNQRLVSSGTLEFTDRTINNKQFNIDRDFGVFVDYSVQNTDKFSYNFKSAISRGEGRNYTKNKDDGVCLTGKVELFPFGSFNNNGSLFEGDLFREKTPKLMISGVFSQNNRAVRSQGQLGSDLFEARTIQSLFFDTMLKYNGWAASASYMSRMADDAITVNPLDVTKTQAVFVGHGIDTQLSYVFPSKYQIAGRFSTQKADSQISAFTPNVDEYAMSLSKYLMGHKLKVQTECSYENSTLGGTTTGSWYVRFQVEIGI